MENLVGAQAFPDWTAERLAEFQDVDERARAGPRRTRRLPPAPPSSPGAAAASLSPKARATPFDLLLCNQLVQESLDETVRDLGLTMSHNAEAVRVVEYVAASVRQRVASYIQQRISGPAAQAVDVHAPDTLKLQAHVAELQARMALVRMALAEPLHHYNQAAVQKMAGGDVSLFSWAGGLAFASILLDPMSRMPADARASLLPPPSPPPPPLQQPRQQGGGREEANRVVAGCVALVKAMDRTHMNMEFFIVRTIHEEAQGLIGRARALANAPASIEELSDLSNRAEATVQVVHALDAALRRHLPASLNEEKAQREAVLQNYAGAYAQHMADLAQEFTRAHSVVRSRRDLLEGQAFGLSTDAFNQLRESIVQFILDIESSLGAGGAGIASVVVERAAQHINLGILHEAVAEARKRDAAVAALEPQQRAARGRMQAEEGRGQFLRADDVRRLLQPIARYHIEAGRQTFAWFRNYLQELKEELGSMRPEDMARRNDGLVLAKLGEARCVVRLASAFVAAEEELLRTNVDIRTVAEELADKANEQRRRRKARPESASSAGSAYVARDEPEDVRIDSPPRRRRDEEEERKRGGGGGGGGVYEEEERGGKHLADYLFAALEDERARVRSGAVSPDLFRVVPTDAGQTALKRLDEFTGHVQDLCETARVYFGAYFRVVRQSLFSWMQQARPDIAAAAGGDMAVIGKVLASIASHFNGRVFEDTGDLIIRATQEVLAAEPRQQQMIVPSPVFDPATVKWVVSRLTARGRLDAADLVQGAPRGIEVLEDMDAVSQAVDTTRKFGEHAMEVLAETRPRLVRELQRVFEESAAVLTSSATSGVDKFTAAARISLFAPRSVPPRRGGDAEPMEVQFIGDADRFFSPWQAMLAELERPDPDNTRARQKKDDDAGKLRAILGRLFNQQLSAARLLSAVWTSFFKEAGNILSQRANQERVEWFAGFTAALQALPLRFFMRVDAGGTRITSVHVTADAFSGDIAVLLPWEEEGAPAEDDLDATFRLFNTHYDRFSTGVRNIEQELAAIDLILRTSKQVLRERTDSAGRLLLRAVLAEEEGTAAAGGGGGIGTQPSMIDASLVHPAALVPGQQQQQPSAETGPPSAMVGTGADPVDEKHTDDDDDEPAATPSPLGPPAPAVTDMAIPASEPPSSSRRLAEAVRDHVRSVAESWTALARATDAMRESRSLSDRFKPFAEFIRDRLRPALDEFLVSTGVFEAEAALAFRSILDLLRVSGRIVNPDQPDLARAIQEAKDVYETMRDTLATDFIGLVGGSAAGSRARASADRFAGMVVEASKTWRAMGTDFATVRRRLDWWTKYAELAKQAIRTVFAGPAGDVVADQQGADPLQQQTYRRVVKELYPPLQQLFVEDPSSRDLGSLSTTRLASVIAIYVRHAESAPLVAAAAGRGGGAAAPSAGELAAMSKAERDAANLDLLNSNEAKEYIKAHIEVRAPLVRLVNGDKGWFAFACEASGFSGIDLSVLLNAVVWFISDPNTLRGMSRTTLQPADRLRALFEEMRQESAQRVEEARRAGHGARKLGHNLRALVLGLGQQNDDNFSGEEADERRGAVSSSLTRIPSMVYSRRAPAAAGGGGDGALQQDAFSLEAILDRIANGGGANNRALPSSLKSGMNDSDMNISQLYEYAQLLDYRFSYRFWEIQDAQWNSLFGDLLYANTIKAGVLLRSINPSTYGDARLVDFIYSDTVRPLLANLVALNLLAVTNQAKLKGTTHQAVIVHILRHQVTRRHGADHPLMDASTPPPTLAARMDEFMPQYYRVDEDGGVRAPSSSKWPLVRWEPFPRDLAGGLDDPWVMRGELSIDN